jgi:prephenate dehydratase
MADTIRKLGYFYFAVDDKAGEGARVLGKLRETQVNLLSLTAFPIAGGRTQVTVVPEKPDAFLAAAKAAGLDPSARKECFLVQGGDRVGAVHDVLKRLAEAKINCTAANGCCAGGGSYGMVLFVKPADVAAAAKALGA